MTEFLSTKQLSEMIHRTEPAIRNLVMRRQIPFRKPGGRLLFVREEIRKWVLDADGVSYADLQKEKASTANRGFSKKNSSR